MPDISVTPEQVTEVASRVVYFVTEASTLGIESFPLFIATEMGNKMPFALDHVDAERTAHYKQTLGIIRLKVFND